MDSPRNDRADSGMRIQFGARVLLLATALVAIALGGSIAAWEILVARESATPLQPWEMARVFLIMGPWWIPFVFFAYCLGRRTISVAPVLLFALVEAVAVVGFHWLTR